MRALKAAVSEWVSLESVLTRSALMSTCSSRACVTCLGVGVGVGVWVGVGVGVGVGVRVGIGVGVGLGRG